MPPRTASIWAPWACICFDDNGELERNDQGLFVGDGAQLSQDFKIMHKWVERSNTDMIGEMATAIATGLTAGQLMMAMRAHPTYSEGIGMAIEDAMRTAVQ